VSLEDVSYEARDELASLARKLSESPETRADFLRLTKKVRPDVSMPELDIEDRTNSMLKRSEARVASLEAKLHERDAIEKLEKRRSDLVQNGFVSNRAEIQEVEKIMIEKGITNHEAAAEYHKWMKQSAVPTPTGYNPNPMKQFDLSAFRKNPVQAAREVAAQAMTEFRRPARPIGL
jgi:hypothetical protein